MLDLLTKRIPIKVMSGSPIQELCEKYDLEEQIKNDLKKQNTHIESIYIDKEEIAIKFYQEKNYKTYEVTPEDILHICTYLGSFNYRIVSDYGVVIKFDIRSINIVENIELIKVFDRTTKKLNENLENNRDENDDKE